MGRRVRHGRLILVALPATARMAVIAQWAAQRDNAYSVIGLAARELAPYMRERPREADREADAAECLLWSEQMEGFGGPAQPSPTIAQCLNGGYG